MNNPVIEPLVRVKSINIDFPFVQPLDKKIDGTLATSFTTVRGMIDRAIQLGFNTISFDTNVPIDAQTGSLQFLVPNSVNGDKTFPEDIWKSVEYAESKGLKTVLDLCIRNAINDVPIRPNNVGSFFSKDVFFESVRKYETEIAAKAASYGVDGIRVGKYNFGFDQQEYREQWIKVIDSIRSAYKGTLQYTATIENRENALWSLVDEIKVKIDSRFDLQKNFQEKDIAPLYLLPYEMGNGVVSEQSVYSRILYLVNQYKSKKVSLEVSFESGKSAGFEGADIWSYIFEENPLLDNAKDKSILIPYPEDRIDMDLNLQKIAGFFEFFGNYLSDKISGIQYFQYAPWTEAEWIRHPKTQGGFAWQSVARANGVLNWDPEAEAMVGKYLNREWGFKTLHYGSSSADVFTGSELSEKFYSSGGSDFFDGKDGFDVAIYSAKFGDVNIEIGERHAVLSKGYGNIDKLSNIERIEFADIAINRSIQSSSKSIDSSTLKTIEELYVAFFNRIPDADGLEYWLNAASSGSSINSIADNFYSAGVFYSTVTGYSNGMSAEEFVRLIYKNVLGRADGGDAEGIAYWVDRLNQNMDTRGSVVTTILNSAHTFKGSLTYGYVADLLDNKAAVAHELAVKHGLNFNSPEESISRGISIAKAITPTDMSSALTLVGVDLSAITYTY